MAKPKKWGIYVYYAADVPAVEMQKAAWNCLESLAAVGSDGQYGITAMIDLPGRDTAYYVLPEQRAGRATLPVHPDRFLPNVNSASLETIADFLQWSSKNCPAENVALIFWGHGYALDDYDPTSHRGAVGASVGSQGKGRLEQRSASGFSGGRGNELSLLYDSTHDAVLNNRDFGSILRSYLVSLGSRKKIQLLGLDCCNMAMAEVVSELQDYAEYIVAAESMLPYRSWLTRQFLTNFRESPEIYTTLEFAQNAVDLFIASYEPSDDPYLELSACKMCTCSQLEKSMKNLTTALIRAIDETENRAAIDRAWLSGVTFLVDGFIDLGAFCGFLRIEMSGVQEVCETAYEVQRAIASVVVYYRTAPEARDKKISLATGLTIWFPPWIRFPSVSYPQIDQSKNFLFNGYSQTHFAQVTNWDRFLYKLFALTQGQ